ncbi:MAG: FAD synthase [Methanosarcinaceae archaeon]|nr:FAD synthase [Methanosarcinaceae archaeon]
MTRILATGTFEILHPGHLYFLNEAKALGDELFVVVARDENIRHKPKPVICEEQRCEMVGALRVVDKAILGDKENFLNPVIEIKPDIIVLGYDQHFNEKDLEKKLKENNINAKVVRLPKREGKLFSSRKIVAKIKEKKKLF